VAMDSNARSKTWHDVLTNKRGRKLEEFVISNHIHIVNEDSKLTIFQSNRGNFAMFELLAVPQRGMPYIQKGFRIILYISNLFFIDNSDFNTEIPK
jgi:hypothetical protein